MNEPIQPEPDAGMHLNDILFILFRHKRLIFLSSLAGIVAAVLFYTHCPIYESQAKLMVRYVLERSAVDKVDSGPTSAIMGTVGDSIINSEVEILTSADLAEQVAETVGIDRLLPQSLAGGGLKVTARFGSNVILISYKNKNPKTAQRVLENLVSQYFDKHLQVHRSLGSFAFASKQTEQVRSQLHQTEEELKRLKSTSGIVSVANSTTTVTDGMAKSQGDLDAAEVERAEQRARVKQIENWFAGLGVNQTASGPQTEKQRDGIQEYQTLRMRMEDLRRRERELLSRYTPESQQVKLLQTQISAVEYRQRELEKLNPGLLATAAITTPTSPSSRFDLVSERTRLATIDAKAETLSEQLKRFQQKAEQLSETGMAIAQLERKKELEESNYRYFEASLEKARIDETLDPSKIPNISIVQSPTPARKDMGHMSKIALGMVGGGIGFGLALAFIIELLWDRTVKRPLEIESRLNLPLLVSIPYVEPCGGLSMKTQTDETEGQPTVREIARQELGLQIRPYFEAIRDRLILYFELNRMTRKPKMIAVTGMSTESGISTVATGLAASLSETGDGNVLLVNMNIGQAEVHPYLHGREAGSLTDILKTHTPKAPIGENLYLATVSPTADDSSQFFPKKFYDLIPNLKASDFDYIIFDMPPLSQTSTTVALAGFMDKVLLVIEAGMTNPNVLKRNYRELVSAKADVACVFNKARTSGPKWVEGDY